MALPLINFNCRLYTAFQVCWENRRESEVHIHRAFGHDEVHMQGILGRSVQTKGTASSNVLRLFFAYSSNVLRLFFECSSLVLRGTRHSIDQMKSAITLPSLSLISLISLTSLTSLTSLSFLSSHLLPHLIYHCSSSDVIHSIRSIIPYCVFLPL